MSEGNSTLKDKSFLFAIEIIKVYKALADEKREFVLSKQLLRSGTAIGALIRESQNAESKADFIHKLGIAQKECDETLYWLDLLFHSQYLDERKYTEIHENAVTLLKMLRSAILTTKERYTNKQPHNP